MELFTAQHDGGDEIQQIQQKVRIICNNLPEDIYETIDRMKSYFESRII